MPRVAPANTSRSRSSSSSIVHLFVNGMACPDVNRILPAYVKQLPCNTPFRSTVAATRAYCGMPPKSTDKYVIQVRSQILAELGEGKDVHVYGWSYGGAVVTAVAKTFADAPKLHFYTFGSIYIAPSHINIQNYMYRGDISVRCTNPKEDQVVWVDPPSLSGYNQVWLNKRRIVGTNQEWVIHGQYFRLIKKIIIQNDENHYTTHIPSQRPRTGGH